MTNTHLPMRLTLLGRQESTCVYPALTVILGQTPVFRLIDKSLNRHYISAGQIWKACDLTITEGLFLFDLGSRFKIDFDLTEFAFPDIWVSVEEATIIAERLNVEERLQHLLSDSLHGICAWRHEDSNDLMVNWKIHGVRAEKIEILLQCQFEQVERLVTPNPVSMTTWWPSKRVGSASNDALSTALVYWQGNAYRRFLNQPHNEDADHPDKTSVRTGEAIWDAFQAMQNDIGTLTRQGLDTRQELPKLRIPYDRIMVGNMPLERSFLGQSRTLQHVYMSVMLEKIYKAMLDMIDQRLKSSHTYPLGGNASRESELANDSKPMISTWSPTTGSTMDRTAPPGPSQMLLHDRMDTFEQDINHVKHRLRKDMNRVMRYQQQLQQQMEVLELWRQRQDKEPSGVFVFARKLIFPLVFALLISYVVFSFYPHALLL